MTFRERSELEVGNGCVVRTLYNLECWCLPVKPALAHDPNNCTTSFSERKAIDNIIFNFKISSLSPRILEQKVECIGPSNLDLLQDKYYSSHYPGLDKSPFLALIQFALPTGLRNFSN